MGGRQRTSIFIEKKRELSKEKAQAAKTKEKQAEK